MADISQTLAPDFTVTPLTHSFGAEISGLDLGQPLAPKAVDALREVFLEHPVLVFREQELSRGDQVRFTGYFGPMDVSVNRQYHGDDFPQVHTVSNLDADGRPIAVSALDNPGNYFWHTDGSYQAHPPAASLLYGVTIPSAGGVTSFLSLCEAYEALDATQQERIDGLRLVHSWAQSRRNSGSRPPTEEEIAKSPPTTHPLVRTHPVTGRKALYFGLHVSHVEDMAAAEGQALLAELLEHTTLEERIYHHHWSVGDLVICDNRCVMHRGSPEFDASPEPRILHRTVVSGDQPR
jgi:alpha-ketoglutarate-dependent taurine dioxygenase